jgi:hypothetical protein
MVNMSDSPNPKWVPASLMRIRCFLNRRGMKVKPWLGPDAVLSAFFTTLRSQENNDGFWSELTELLRVLADDMNERVSSCGWVIDNELLDKTGHDRLLAEIRKALSNHAAPAELKPFALTLPKGAGALLLMLAAAIVIGCDGESETGNTGTASGGTTAGASATGGAANHTGGAGGKTASSTITFGGTGGTTSGYPCPNPGVTSGLNASDFAACNAQLVAALIPYDLESNDGRQLLQCACLLNDSWQTGLANLFSGHDCGEIASYLGTCGVSDLCAKQAAGTVPTTFDADLFLNCSVVTLYLGVRCD